MSVNTHRGEMEVEFGGRTRKMAFRFSQLCMLEGPKHLDMGVLNWFVNQRSQSYFLKHSLFVGLAKFDKTITPALVDDFMDDYLGDPNQLSQDILYAIARGKPKQEGDEMLEALDKGFKDEDEDEAGDTENPSVNGVSESTPLTSPSPTLQPTA